MSNNENIVTDIKKNARQALMHVNYILQRFRFQYIHIRHRN